MGRQRPALASLHFPTSSFPCTARRQRYRKCLSPHASSPLVVVTARRDGAQKPSSAGVAQSAGNAVDRQQADPAKLLAIVVRSASKARQQLDLDERKRIDERVATGDRRLQHWLRVEQALVAA